MPTQPNSFVACLLAIIARLCAAVAAGPRARMRHDHPATAVPVPQPTVGALAELLANPEFQPLFGMEPVRFGGLFRPFTQAPAITPPAIHHPAPRPSTNIPPRTSPTHPAPCPLFSLLRKITAPAPQPSHDHFVTIT